MKFRYNDNVAIIIKVKGKEKLVKRFTVKQTKTLCDKLLSRWVVEKFGYTLGTFRLMKT